MAEDPGELVALARLVKPRGRRGETVADDWCEDPARFAPGAEVVLRDVAGRTRPAKIEEAWDHQGRLILKFEGVDSISGAEELRGLEVCVPFVELGPPPEGEHYYLDLIGCAVRDADDGREIGVVEAIQEPGGPIVLEVRRDGREVLIPFVSAICVEVDTRAKSIRARLPEGLEELND